MTNPQQSHHEEFLSTETFNETGLGVQAPDLDHVDDIKLRLLSQAALQLGEPGNRAKPTTRSHSSPAVCPSGAD